ncbi:DUF397 domain-containing protein [Actinomadura sp. BRA 177]|uniref:DUF397 domain-containing protein n=1 Tax=Actinomadura sp. BRA 177 TaxID=2745202 RepID=UPI0015954573|nr:DUF397 domain-containing protein [Actinomadura sp. BRA 177]NVI91958.1 DUF397 domain-containing protein [Actinomadura sp. BRA 177]
MIKWRKASRSTSEGGACVELAQLLGAVGVRDSEDPDGPAFTLPVSAARALLDTVKRGEHDTP